MKRRDLLKLGVALPATAVAGKVEIEEPKPKLHPMRERGYVWDEKRSYWLFVYYDVFSDEMRYSIRVEAVPEVDQTGVAHRKMIENYDKLKREQLG